MGVEKAMPTPDPYKYDLGENWREKRQPAGSHVVRIQWYANKATLARSNCGDCHLGLDQNGRHITYPLHELGISLKLYPFFH